jgi:hypothetical protein
VLQIDAIMKSLVKLILLFFVITSCSETIDNTGTCSDGVKNQGEQGIDCGGPCPGACPSCADGIMNQGETAVDCGGPCDPCYPRLSAKIDGVEWSATSRNAFLSAPGTIRIYGTNTQSNFTLYYSGVFVPGTENAGAMPSEQNTETQPAIYIHPQVEVSVFQPLIRFQKVYQAPISLSPMTPLMVRKRQSLRECLIVLITDFSLFF